MKFSPRIFQPFLWLLPVIAITAAFGDVVAPRDLDEKGKKKKNIEDIPDPVPGIRRASASVIRGQEVEIILQAVTSTRKQVIFLLRSQPQVGTVRGPFPMSRDGIFDRAKLIYSSPADTGATADLFHFAARLEGGVISAPETITVQLLDAMPELELPASLSFGDVTIGESVEKTVTVKNTGTATYDNIPSLPSPWYAAVPGEKFRVPAGGSADFRVLFAPTASGQQRARFSLGGDGAKSFTIFDGTGLAPFTVYPPTLTLTYDPVSGVRNGVIQISNTTDQAKNIDIIADESVGIARKIEVPASKSVTVPVSVITASDGEEVKTELAVRWQSHVQKVKLRAEPEPAKLSAADENFSGTLVLPRALERSERRAAFSITNSGGKPGSVFATATAPFSVRDEDRDFKLAPGETREILIGIRSLTSGPQEGTVKFVSGKTTFELPVRGTVVAKLSELNAPEDPDAAPAVAPEEDSETEPSVVPSTTTTSSPQAEESALAGLGELADAGDGTGGPAVVTSEMLDLEAALAEAEAGERNAAEDFTRKRNFDTRDPAVSARRKLETFVFQKGFGKPRKTDKSIPTVKNARLIERGKHHVTVAWKAPGGVVYDYEFDRQRLFYQQKTGRMSKLWVPHESVEITQSGDDVTARIEKLDYGGQFGFRLYTHDESRGYSYSSPMFNIATKARKPPLPWRWIIVIILGFILVGAVAYQKLRNRNLGGRRARR